MAYLTETSALNEASPMVMHIDLNSAFASIEQQANPLLRGKPVGVCSYLTPGGIILAASYEAKAKGVGTGTPIREARVMCPGMVFLMPDPDKYFYVNAQLYALLYQYTNELTPLSIDEFAIDFATSSKLHNKPLRAIALEIKRRIRSEIGSWMRVNIGIGPNRFLAKLAASLHKPDGLDIINHKNLKAVYSQLGLRDLCGINFRFEARLNLCGIYSPLDFLDAPLETLHRRAFKSVQGYHWYHRLRGWEVDNIEYGRKSFGKDYALPSATADKKELSQLLMKLSEQAGRRMRRKDKLARGASLWLLYDDHTFWRKSSKVKNIIYSTNDIHAAMQRLLNQQPHPKPVSKMGLAIFDLKHTYPEQLELFDTVATKQRRMAIAVDTMNDRYGEFTVIPATMMGMEHKIIKRVPFGASRDLADMYQQMVQDYRLT